MVATDIRARAADMEDAARRWDIAVIGDGLIGSHSVVRDVRRSMVLAINLRFFDISRFVLSVLRTFYR